MAIFISASALNDFISCSRKVYYRIFEKDKAVPSKESLIGTITHRILEKSWDNLEKAKSLVNEFCLQENLDESSINAVETYVHTYFENFSGYVSKSDLIEHRFKLKLEKDVYLVGVFDRVSNGNVFDWKTSKTTPKSLEGNIQFNIYNMAYKMLFNSEPSGLYLASLREGKLVRYVESKKHLDVLRSGIIPEFVETVRKNEFVKTGMFNGGCYFCPYKKDCLSEGEENVMVHTKFIEG